MKIGLTIEGKYDKPLEIIIRRILNDPNVTFVTDLSDGPITAKIKPNLEKYFNLKNTDAAIFCTDADKNSKKENWLRRRHKKEIERWGSKICIFVCPIHCLESWFITEENAIKKHFKLDSTKKLPLINPDHKLQVDLLSNRYNKDITISKFDLYAILANTLNLDILTNKANDFRRFQKALSQLTK